MFALRISDEIQLQILEVRHADELYHVTDKNRMYLREWLPWVDGTVSPEQTKGFIQSALRAYADNDGMNTAIVYKGNIVGCIGLHSINWNHKRTSIGYWLGAEYQGLGLMTRACKEMIHYVFHELELNRVEIRAATANKKSRAIPERLQFVNEGTVRKVEWLYDHYVDHVIYGMLKEDWLNLNL